MFTNSHFHLLLQNNITINTVICLTHTMRALNVKVPMKRKSSVVVVVDINGIKSHFNMVSGV